ncbi:hypothetical protein BH11ARM1_BH11ARM1_07510 [soil metagenome]
MPRVQRLSDLIEIQAEHAIYYGTGGLASLLSGGFLAFYKGNENSAVPLAVVLMIIGLVLCGVAIRSMVQVRKVVGIPVNCPFCEFVNELLERADQDFSCTQCSRMIPIDANGDVMPVQQVRCGYCNELNFYSEKTGALLCEECNHEIPIAGDDNAPKKSIPKAYMVIDDESLYELILLSRGKHKEEELINALQHMLALNRNQVKQMLDELPVTVLTGITRKKAEMLKAQLSMYDAQVDMKPMVEVHN